MLLCLNYGHTPLFGTFPIRPPPFNGIDVSAQRATFGFVLNPTKLMLRKRVCETRTYGAELAVPLLTRLASNVDTLKLSC
jgi:hypothetical protein